MGPESFFFPRVFAKTRLTTTEKKPSGEVSKRSESGRDKDTLVYVCVLFPLEKSWDFISVWSIHLVKKGGSGKAMTVIILQDRG